MSLSGVDVRALVWELKQKIIGSWIVNIYHLPGNIIIFKIRKPKEGLDLLLIEPGKRLHLTTFNRIMPKEPSNYCKALRSHLRDKRINSIEQRDLDRIIILNIGPDEGIQFVIELFGQGNVVMVSPQNKIINALSYRKMRDRDIHPGRDFVQMPSQPRDLLKNGLRDFDNYLKNNEKVVPALNQWLGLGPTYSRLLLKNAGIRAKKSAEIGETARDKLIHEASLLKDKLENNEFEPIVYIDSELIIEELDLEEDDEYIPTDYDDQWEESALDFQPENVIKILPWNIESVEDEIEIKSVSSFNTAVDIFWSSQEKNETLDVEIELLESEEEKLTRLLNQQLKHKDEFQSDVDKFQSYGDALYANFQPGTELLETVYNARKQNMAWDEIEERLLLGKEKNIASATLFDKLLIKEAKIRVKLPVDDSNIALTLDFRKSLLDNANIFYEKSKRSKRKIQGADIAIQKTRDKLERATEKAESIKDGFVIQAPVLRRRKAWYEKFHWTKTFGGYLILVGTDASTNERLVKRYFDEDDLFIHADVQGAATTILKANGREISTEAKNNAATMAVCYSSAWKAQRVISDAFLVSKDQVSLSAPSGEFMPKGSFMIYGEKEFIKDVKLEIYIGIVIESNWARVIYGTLKSVETAFVCFKVVPGETQRGKIAKSIKREALHLVEDVHKNKIKALEVSDIAFAVPGHSKIEKTHSTW